ncbi:MAG: NPCBM/NEW2 domain-containing protein [Saprospiraceae bacterium]|nr:NPCBM/NEW2 domain-containing protein [Saprospiraceae bacterium]
MKFIKDDMLAYQSPLITGADSALFIQVDISGADRVKLVVNDGGDGLDCDHADWADARFLPCACIPTTPCDDGDPCTIDDQLNYDCDCVGLYVDSDSDDDGISDPCDVCPGHDDLLDADNDGIPDGCDECIGMQGSICESGDCLVNDDTIPSGTHAALLRISSGGKVVDDSIVTFQSTGLIELAPGFKVDNGAIFEAQIVDCENILSSKKLTEINANILPMLNTSSLSSIQDFWINYEIKERAQITIEIKDKTGKPVHLALAPTTLEVGRYGLRLNKILPDGVYFIQLQFLNGVIQKKLLVVDGLVKSFSESTGLPDDSMARLR